MHRERLGMKSNRDIISPGGLVRTHSIGLYRQLGGLGTWVRALPFYSSTIFMFHGDKRFVYLCTWICIFVHLEIICKWAVAQAGLCSLNFRATQRPWSLSQTLCKCAINKHALWLPNKQIHHTMHVYKHSCHRFERHGNAVPRPQIWTIIIKMHFFIILTWNCGKICFLINQSKNITGT